MTTSHSLSPLLFFLSLSLSLSILSPISPSFSLSLLWYFMSTLFFLFLYLFIAPFLSFLHNDVFVSRAGKLISFYWKECQPASSSFSLAAGLVSFFPILLMRAAMSTFSLYFFSFPYIIASLFWPFLVTTCSFYIMVFGFTNTTRKFLQLT